MFDYIKLLFAWLTYGTCDACGYKKRKVYHFHGFYSEGKSVEDVCEDCIVEEGEKHEQRANKK